MHLEEPDPFGKSVTKRRTVFLTAVRVIGTSPHHLNPAIILGRTSAIMRVVAPADPPGKFESGSIVEEALPKDALRLVDRTPKLASRLGWYARSWRAARQALREIDADLLFVYGSQIAVVALFLIPLLRRGTTVAYYTQDFIEPRRHPLRAALEALVCRRAKHVIVNERSRGRILQSIYGLKKPPQTVPTGLLIDWPVPKRSTARRDWLLALSPTPLMTENEPLLIVHQGPLRKNRCGIELLRSLECLPSHYRLVVTGMTRRELEKMAVGISEELANRVILPGSLNFQDLLEVTASCDIGVLLYPNDGIGNFFQAPGRLSENGRAGLPSIASNFPPFEKIAVEFGFLELCDPNSPTDIATSLSALGRLSVADRIALGERARDHSLEAFNFERDMNEALAEISHGRT